MYGREYGMYKLHGEKHPCDCDTQITLRKHYLIAGIGDQYQRLDWDAEYDGDENASFGVEQYLENWKNLRRHGMGIEFTSPNLGVGKTFAATHIAKFLIKQGEKVKFVHFKDVISAFEKSNAEEIEEELKSVTYLVLDEVLAPVSPAQANLFGPKFEELIRHRTNLNLPTIMTTNLTEDQLKESYPRTYSLLQAKQVRIPMKGSDQRRGQVASHNLELALNGEIRPIT